MSVLNPALLNQFLSEKELNIPTQAGIERQAAAEKAVAAAIEHFGFADEAKEIFDQFLKAHGVQNTAPLLSQYSSSVCSTSSICARPFKTAAGQLLAKANKPIEADYETAQAILQTLPAYKAAYYVYDNRVAASNEIGSRLVHGEVHDTLTAQKVVVFKMPYDQMSAQEARQLSVGDLPSLIFMDRTGNEVGRVSGLHEFLFKAENLAKGIDSTGKTLNLLAADEAQLRELETQRQQLEKTIAGSTSDSDRTLNQNRLDLLQGDIYFLKLKVAKKYLDRGADPQFWNRGSRLCEEVIQADPKNELGYTELAHYYLASRLRFAHRDPAAALSHLSAMLHIPYRIYKGTEYYYAQTLFWIGKEKNDPRLKEEAVKFLLLNITHPTYTDGYARLQAFIYDPIVGSEGKSILAKLMSYSPSDPKLASFYQQITAPGSSILADLQKLQRADNDPSTFNQLQTKWYGISEEEHLESSRHIFKIYMKANQTQPDIEAKYFLVSSAGRAPIEWKLSFDTKNARFKLNGIDPKLLPSGITTGTYELHIVEKTVLKPSDETKGDSESLPNAISRAWAEFNRFVQVKKISVQIEQNGGVLQVKADPNISLTPLIGIVTRIFIRFPDGSVKEWYLPIETNTNKNFFGQITYPRGLPQGAQPGNYQLEAIIGLETDMGGTYDELISRTPRVFNQQVTVQKLPPLNVTIPQEVSIPSS